MKNQRHSAPALMMAGCLVFLASAILCWKPVFNDASSAYPVLEQHKGVFTKVVVTDQRLIAVGEHGRILFSVDEGRTWNWAKSPVTENLTNVFFIDAQVGWAIGQAGVVLKTENGGLSWDLIRSVDPNGMVLFDVWFKNRDEGMIIGQDQTILYTQDGGRTFRPFQFKIQSHLYALVPGLDGALWIVGENRTIYKSQNMGETWTKVNVPFKSSFFSAVPVSAHQIMTCGLEGRVSFWGPWGILYSKKICEENLNASVWLKDNRILLMGEKGRMVTVSLKPKRFEIKQLPFLETVSSVVERGDALVLTGTFGIKRVLKRDIGL